MDSAYDRALSEIGEGGKFQKKFDFMYSIGLSAFQSAVYLHLILALTVIPHTCRLPEKTQNVTDEAWKLKYIPHENSYGKIKFDRCQIYLNPDVNNLTRSKYLRKVCNYYSRNFVILKSSKLVTVTERGCDEYEYDNTWYNSTVSSEKNWVCDKEIYIPNIIAYSKVTELIGSMFFGWTGDTYGRRPTYIMTLSVTLIGRIISIVSGQSYIIFLCGSMIASLGTFSIMQSITVISVEITSAKRRSMVTSVRFGAGCSGGVSLLVDWGLENIHHRHHLTSSAVLVIFLYSNGKTKECVKQLKQIAKTNRKRLQSKSEQEILSYVPQHTTNSLGPIAFFSSRSLAINTVLQLLLWAIGTMCFTLQILSIGQNSDANPFLEFCWQALSEIPANFASAWCADRLGRRYTSAMGFCSMSVAWFLLAIRETSSYSWTKGAWIGTTLNMIIRFVNAMTYYVANLFAIELYPTVLRQSALSLGNVCASLGSVIAPYILFLGRPIDERLPGLVISALASIAMCSSLMLPETLNKKLPETIEETRSFGRKKQTYSSVPLQVNDNLKEKNVEEITKESLA